MRTVFLGLFGFIAIYALISDAGHWGSTMALYEHARDGVGSGAQLYRKCRICHSLEPGRHKVGPSLHCVVNRQIAAFDDFRYSPAMLAQGKPSADGRDSLGHWTRETLAAYVLAPHMTIPGTRMPFPGLASTYEADALTDAVTELIDYLESRCDPTRFALILLRKDGRDSLQGCTRVALVRGLSRCESLIADILSDHERARDSDSDSAPPLICLREEHLACSP